MSDQFSNQNPLKDLIKVEDIIKAALKIPGVYVKRDEFLRNAFKKVCPQNQIEKAIKTSPKEAEIDDMVIDRVAEKTITNETNKVSAISFVAGIPGGMAMAGTISGIATAVAIVVAILSLKRIGEETYVIIINEKYLEKKRRQSEVNKK